MAKTTKKKLTKKARKEALVTRPKAKRSLKNIRRTKPSPILKPIVYAKLPNVITLTKTSWNILWLNKKLFLGIGLIYGLLNLILVQGLASSSDISLLKSTVTNLFHGHIGSLFSSLGIFVILLGSSGNGSSQTAGAYQLFLALITSLSIIWALRNLVNDKAIRLRDSYYQSMTPFIPFILVFIVIALELIPLLIGTIIYIVIISNSIAIGWLEQIITLIIFILFAALSLYWLLGSVFAIYIVTLPNMTPIKALKSANKLVKKRRLLILRKLLFLPLALFLVAAVIMIPIVLTISGIAQWVFFILTMFLLIVVHSYIYNLYRELLNEA